MTTELPNLTRKELAQAIADQLGYPLSSCSDIVDSTLATIKQALLAGENVKLVHFGTFSLRAKRPRQGRNPRTGELITIVERRTVSFRASRKLRDRVNV